MDWLDNYIVFRKPSIVTLRIEATISSKIFKAYFQNVQYNWEPEVLFRILMDNIEFVHIVKLRTFWTNSWRDRHKTPFLVLSFSSFYSLFMCILHHSATPNFQALTHCIEAKDIRRTGERRILTISQRINQLIHLSITTTSPWPDLQQKETRKTRSDGGLAEFAANPSPDRRIPRTWTTTTIPF